MNAKHALLGASLLLAQVFLAAGCGNSSYIRMKVARPDSFEQPVWVGAFFLSQETALDGVETRDLIDQPDSYGPSAGVVDKEVFPVYPGEAARSLAREKYDPRIGWVLLVGAFPNSEPCAREKIKVKPESELTLQVSVEEQCLKVNKKK